eukprot:g20435.t1
MLSLLQTPQEQSAMQLVTMELRTDLERSAQEAVNLCSEVLREEQHQLVREFREDERDTVTEKVRRCDTAAALCERLARSMAWQVLPEAGSGMPGQAQAYEGLILKREGPWALGDARGRYAFDETTGWLTTQGSHVGRFICKMLGNTG